MAIGAQKWDVHLGYLWARCTSIWHRGRRNGSARRRGARHWNPHGHSALRTPPLGARPVLWADNTVAIRTIELQSHACPAVFSKRQTGPCRAPLAIQSYLAGSSRTTIVASLTCAGRKLTLRITLHLFREIRVIRGSISSMAIAVVCPSCHARFQVQDKFAGKEGPCPKC